MKWNELNQLFSVVKNYGEYRTKYQKLSSKTPRIPLMSLWMNDFNMLDQIPTFEETGKMINIEKMKNLRELIEAVRLTKSLQYVIKEIDCIQSFLEQ